jgi:hypothetical protein
VQHFRPDLAGEIARSFGGELGRHPLTGRRHRAL